MKGLIFNIGILTILIIVTGYVISTSIDFNIESEYCSVCDWNYHHWQLLDYNDPGHGHAGALQEIWDSANYGKQVDLEWYENYRLKYNLTSVNSFTLINYDNVCPQEPNLKYIGTGYIINFVDWSYDGPAYSQTTICINNSNTTYSNCGWHPYPFNKSCLTHVFREKHNAWWNQFKHAELYDASIYVDMPENNNQSWKQYYIDYDNYLDNGGADVGSEY